MSERDYDDAVGLDGRGGANIFDEHGAEEAEEAEALGEANPFEADDDGFELDGALGPPGRGGKVVHYDGADWIEGVPTRDDLVAESDTAGTSAALRRHLDAGKPIFFMPVDVEDTHEYADGLLVYTLSIYGVLMDGSKAFVKTVGVPVFADVVVPETHWQRLAEFDAHLRHVLADAGVAGVSIEAVEAYPIRGYSVAPHPYRRVHTATLQQRKKAIAAIRAAGMATASDDRTCYYRKAAREHGLPLSDWAVLSDYEYATGPTDSSPLCTHLFRVPVTGLRPLVDTLAPKEKREAASRTKAKMPRLAKDPTLVAAWDTETHSGRGTGDVPDPQHDEDNCFMICMTAHWKDDPTPLKQICIVDVATAPDPAWTTVVCGTPANVLKAFALCWRALAPDILVGFNDSNYDWPFVVEKARKLGLLSWMFGQMTAAPRRGTTDEAILRWNYCRDKKVKITAEEIFYSSYLKVPGCVPIDVRVCYKKLFPKSETPKAGSLKFYLEVSGLAGKADMPVKRMWRYYEAALETEGDPDEGCAEHMRQVGHYCVIDAVRCQQLLVRRNVLNDYREVSSLAFVSLFDSHYYAGGMKVCNLLGAYAARRNMLLSMIPLEREEGGKYPGAYVFPPEKGIVPDPGRLAALDAASAAAAHGAHDADAVRAAIEAFAADRPVTGLDFASLYPSLIMAYNLSTEKILLTAEQAAYWQAQGRRLHPIEFPFNGRTVRGWSVLHEGRAEEIGLYPTVLIDLFAKRAEMKGVLAAHGAVKELLELVYSRARRDGVEVAAALRLVREEALAERDRTAAALAPGAPPPRVSPGSTLAEEVADLRRLNRNAGEQVAGAERVLALAGPADDEALGAAAVKAAVKAEYDLACFNWTCANSKQAALKVYMNTFYGEAGNSLSPFFLLQLAGGVTSAGQYNIKLVADFVRGKGFRIKYGDSVTGDTALVVRHGGVVQTARIDELVPDAAWRSYHGGKEAATVPGLEVWQDGGFTPVGRVIRHAHSGPITRVLTHTGVVDCTADHSLLGPAGQKVRPADVRVGDELLHAGDHELIRELDLAAHRAAVEGGLDHGCAQSLVGADEAFAMGLFAADGSCGVYQDAARRTVKYSWAINNLDTALLARAAGCLPFPTKILDTVGSSGVYKLVPVGDIKGPTLRYSALFYNAHREKRVPSCVLGGELAAARAFWQGFYAGDGHRAEQQRQTAWRIDQKGKEMCTGLWLLGRRLGWEVSLNDRGDKPNIFRLCFSGAQGRKRPLAAIKKLRPLEAAPGHVYDLETESHHFHVGPGDLVVHNTDSLYLVAPNRCFEDCDADYTAGRIGREEWMSAMVRITMRALNQIRDEVNDHLRADNGTPYLKMAYEEVLYPVVFTGKKKYFGIPHLNEVNFRPDKLFIRGIDVVKQGQPGLAREIGYRIMWACMALDNTRTVRQIVEDTLRDAVVNGAQWNFDHFVKTDAWKPHKDNKPVHRFIGRMRARLALEVAENLRVTAAGGTPKPYLYELPEPGERFSYVITKTGAAFDLHGRKSALKKGDRMEFAKAARELGLEVDVAFYMISYVVGLCARFINGEAAFQPPPSAALTEKKADEMSQKAAKKTLEAFVKSLSNLDGDMLKRRGYAYRRAFGLAAAAAREALVERVGEAAAGVLHGDWLDFELFGDSLDDAEDDADEHGGAPQDSTSKLVEALWASAGAYADSIVAADGDDWCEALGRALGIGANGADIVPAHAAGLGPNQQIPLAPPPAPRQVPPLASPLAPKGSAGNLFRATAVARRRPPADPVAAIQASYLDRCEAEARAALAGMAPAVADIAARYEASLSRLVLRRRLDEHESHPEIGLPEAGETAPPEAAPLGEADPLGASGDASGVSGRAEEDVLLGVAENDREALLDFRRVWFTAVGIQLTRRRAVSYAGYLRRLKDRRLGVAAAPSRAEREKAIAAAAAKLHTSGDIVAAL
jgi:DNA polymerase elongation subunit (family B)